jgi:hypothetical protein
MADKNGAFNVTHGGVVEFSNGSYAKAAGSANWSVRPIPGFGLDAGPPLGQVKVYFDPAVEGPYVVQLSAQRLPTTPMLLANYGNADGSGFVVHLFDPVATGTLQNGSFSFIVLRWDEEG